MKFASKDFFARVFRSQSVQVFRFNLAGQPPGGNMEPEYGSSQR
jgi:hypothetical protein